MQNVFGNKLSPIVPTILALIGLSATQACSDKASPDPAKLEQQQIDQAHRDYQGGVKEGARQMHDEMMQDHEMGMSAAGNMQTAPTMKPDQAPPPANMPAAPMSDHM